MYRVTYIDGTVKYLCSNHYFCSLGVGVVEVAFVEDTGNVCLKCDDELTSLVNNLLN